MIGKIYRLTIPNNDMTYIGSTKLTLNKRLWNHRSDYRQQRKRVSCFALFEAVDDINDVQIELIEEFVCANALELKVREGYWQSQEENCVNVRKAGRTSQTYYHENKQRYVDYYEANKERINAYRVEHRRAKKAMEANVPKSVPVEAVV